MSDSAPTPDAPSPADGLAAAWERRARSKARDWFVASHTGWSDRRAWDVHALTDLRTLFSGVTAERLTRARVLEIGCGVGRLARHLAPRVERYVGYDIAPSMVAEARARCAEVSNAHFHVARADGVPAEIGGTFDFAIAHAVFIHVPRGLVATIARSAFDRLATRGELRFQVRADPRDDEGFGVHTPDLEAPGPFEVPHAAPPDQLFESIDVNAPDITDLVAAHDGEPEYMGHAFRWRELKDLVDALQPTRRTLARVERHFMYALAVR